MNSEEVLFENLRKIVTQLEQPLTVDDVRDGWTDASQLAFLNLFKNLQKILDAGAAIPDLHIARGMDSWGISSGSLLESAAAISNELRKHAQTRRS